MGRVVKNWKPELVADATVASHRYLWSGAIDAQGNELKDIDLCNTFDERKAAVPYKVGEVVYVKVGDEAVKARIVQAHWERTRVGDLREYYRVQTETKKGLWSKLWEKAYPGFIQRGYKLAGLAPDVLD